MALTIVVKHAGGKKIDAEFGKFVVNTDQSKESGGDESAPEPFDYFLSSLATCAGLYVVAFCQTRDIPTDGIRLVQDHVRDEKTRRLTGIRLRIEVPSSFPEKYHPALRRAAAQCSVKRVMENPPEFDIQTVVVD
jgi:ribosomal protein S12 methylthiotransferase accessory factor